MSIVEESVSHCPTEPAPYDRKFLLGLYERMTLIAASITEQYGEYLRCPVQRVASADVPVPFSPILENTYRPDVPRIVEAAREVMQF